MTNEHLRSMGYVFHRGEYINENQAFISKDNRAFRYGDGFFETIRVMDGQVLFLENHFARMCDCMAALHLNPPSGFSIEQFAAQIHGLLQRNQITAGGRVRATFYRKSAGLYMPASDEMGVFIEAEPLFENEFALSPYGKNVDIFPDFKKDVNKLAVFKTLNAQISIMSALYARERNLDEALIQNYKLAIIESTSSNIFIVSNGVLYTPSVQDGCVGGTMRMNVINLALDNNIKVYECTLNPHNFLSADELFLTNAIRGIEWVATYRTKKYHHDMGRRLVALLNDAARRHITGKSGG